ncbi:hypothetical protein [Streptomyces sp. NPDC047869]|uniref:hypothetical protein n=1 Tax=Streptomyces sp. NPDC047869 TaxID=3154709 RepID=UPI003455E11C
MPALDTALDRAARCVDLVSALIPRTDHRTEQPMVELGARWLGDQRGSRLMLVIRCPAGAARVASPEALSCLPSVGRDAGASSFGFRSTSVTFTSSVSGAPNASAITPLLVPVTSKGHVTTIQKPGTPV